MLRVKKAVLILQLHLVGGLPCSGAAKTNLAGGIDDLGQERLSLVDNLVTEGVLDGGIVAFDEVALAVLDRQRGLA